ncbi:MAG: hypothetical protein JW786_12130 [Desulfobacterales bacterium]|nr:hypothetical protein [Desulfobacterales bacterium]
MSFKENLLKKIQINHLTKKVIDSIGPPDSIQKVDKESMRSLLELRSAQIRKERDLEIYVLSGDVNMGKILVLDNDLPIYRTSVKDVVLRKSPTIKEMINIRNAIKILSDSDVVISKKQESVKDIQKEAIEMLDLSFKKSDLDAIENEGRTSLELKNTEGVLECLSLFAELLEYTSPPKSLRIANHKIIGASTKKENGEILYGPMVIYNLMNDTLKFIDDQVGIFDKEKIEFINLIASGKHTAPTEGPSVFQRLKEAVLMQKA